MDATLCEAYAQQHPQIGADLVLQIVERVGWKPVGQSSAGTNTKDAKSSAKANKEQAKAKASEAKMPAITESAEHDAEGQPTWFGKIPHEITPEPVQSNSALSDMTARILAATGINRTVRPPQTEEDDTE